jgi:hypothetical protein
MGAHVTRFLSFVMQEKFRMVLTSGHQFHQLVYMWLFHAKDKKAACFLKHISPFFCMKILLVVPFASGT